MSQSQLALEDTSVALPQNPTAVKLPSQLAVPIIVALSLTLWFALWELGQAVVSLFS